MTASSRRGLLLTGRLVLVLATVAVLAAAGIGWVIHHRADVAIAEHQVNDALAPNDPNIRQPTSIGATGPLAGSPGSTAVTNSDGATGPTANAGRATGPTANAGGTVSPEQAAALPAQNILVLGLDSRGNATGGVGPGTNQSDVIMVAHLYAGHQQMSVLSIPRDLYVAAPTCKEWNNATGSVSEHTFTSPYSSWKITNAYSVGGPRCTVQAVQALTGLRVDRLITLQFDGFKSIVDALGSVEMTFPAPVIDRHQGAVITRPGTQLVTGDQALRLVRSRIVEGDSTGDIGRINRQQQVLKAMMRKTVSSGVLTDPAKLDKVMQTFIANSTTANVSVDQLLDLARHFAGGNSVKFVILPTTPAPGTDGLHGADADQEIFAALVNDRPIPVSSPSS
ncbi:MAG: LCP family protein [Actinomycetota bacterium]|nr:LCP family protein [Actinomycetota bacterium]